MRGMVKSSIPSKIVKGQKGINSIWIKPIAGKRTKEEITKLDEL